MYMYVYVGHDLSHEVFSFTTEFKIDITLRQYSERLFKLPQLQCV